MAIEHFNLSAALVSFGGDNLGYSGNGVDLIVEPRWNDIPSDLYGGQGGVPSDSQLLGAVAFVTCEFTAFEINEIFARANFTLNPTPFTAGAGTVTLPIIGNFVRQGSAPLAGALVLTGANGSLTFATAFLRQRQQFNMGTKASFWMVGWEAWLDAAATRNLLVFA